MVGLKYVGKKPMPYTDNVYKTGFVWEDRDAVVWMDEAVASKFLKHPDVWQRTDKAPPKSVVVENPLIEPVLEEDEQPERPPLVQLDAMDKMALIDFAQRSFGQKLARNMNEGAMRDRIRNWMNSPIVGG